MTEPKRTPPREAWMWKNVRKTAVRRIDSTSLKPSDASVFSKSSDEELVCTYNWKNCDGAKIHVPGFAAIWQDIPLPIRLPKDEGTYFIDQNASRIPEFPFEPVFRATISMNPSFRFDDVDVLANRNSLRKLLDFCAGRRQDSFRINLHLVDRTVVIERCERSARELIRGYQNAGFGRTFEGSFTKYPPGLEDSAAHHRVLRYQIGKLTCAVRFEVDACYKAKEKEGDGAEILASTIQQLSMGESAGGGEGDAAVDGHGDGAGQRQGGLLPQEAAPMAQSLAAEIKTASKPKGPGMFMPQLWFGRTSWLIVGRHTDGCFEEIKITDTRSQFAGWEVKQQTNLRKLVAVLEELREAVEANGGGNCVAICEKGTGPPVIKVFPSTVARKAVPDDLRTKLWNSGNPS